MKTTKLLIAATLLMAGVLQPLATLHAQFNEWTWMAGDNTTGQSGVYGIQGVAAPANKPGARFEGAEWVDLNGNFWHFGGGASPNFRNDLWKYDPSTSMWAWMKGSTTTNQPDVYGDRKSVV